MQIHRTKLFFVLTLFLSAFLLNAQEIAEHTYYSPNAGYYTFGINAGSAYQSSDIKTNFQGWGASLTLSKNVYYQKGAPLSIDLRARGLYTRSYGLDNKKSFDIANNSILNGSKSLDYLNYPTSTGVTQGFVYQNHRTDIGELSLEAVFRLNKLREQTGWLIGLYGGVGIDGYLTRYNQLNGSTTYHNEYASIDESLSRSQVLNRLKNEILDNTYETYADGFQKGLNVSWMPSLGIELGYQLSPNIAFLLGHRTTFARNNLLDGQQWADDKNDLYHYTSLGLEFNLEGRTRVKTQKPIIDVRLPEYSPFTQRDRYANIRASIKNINSAADVQFYLNNKPEDFSYSQGAFAGNITLKPGRNELVIAASNPFGTTRELLVINWEEGNVVSNPEYIPPTPTPPAQTVIRPDIRFVNPSYNNETTRNQNYNVRATINGISNKNGVQFYVNGQTRNFNFDTRRKELNANISLREGNNTVIIRAENSAGRDEAQRNIVLEIQGEKPIVRINRPSNNASLEANSTTLEATIQNVSNSQDITVMVNGSRIGYVDFRNGTLRKDVSLREGRNTITVSARNRFGNAEDRIYVNVSRPVIESPTARPQVTISSPTNSSITRNATTNVRAKVKNVRSKNNVQLLVNGSKISNFTFNSLSGLLNANITLTKGNNNITVKAQNQGGQDQASVNVRYETGSAPLVSITNPLNSPHTSTSKTMAVKAATNHIANKTNINVWLNGRGVSNFSFSNGQVIIPVSLKKGNNTVRIEVTNDTGTAEDNAVIKHNPPTPKAPTVRITAPQKSGATYQSNRSQVKAVTQNVNSKAEISVLLNGKSINFDYKSNLRLIVADVNLKQGTNRVIIKVQNNGGQDRAETTLNHSPKIVKVPVKKAPKISKVSVSTPATDVFNPDNARCSISATLDNISSKSQISFQFKGKIVKDFTWTPSTKRFRAVVDIGRGSTPFKITVRNNDGEDSVSDVINY